jgi:hypothetical protein
MKYNLNLLVYQKSKSNFERFSDNENRTRVSNRD